MRLGSGEQLGSLVSAGGCCPLAPPGTPVPAEFPQRGGGGGRERAAAPSLAPGPAYPMAAPSTGHRSCLCPDSPRLWRRLRAGLGASWRRCHRGGLRVGCPAWEPRAGLLGTPHPPGPWASAPASVSVAEGLDTLPRWHNGRCVSQAKYRAAAADGQNSQESAGGGLSSRGQPPACLRGLSDAGVGVAPGLAWPWVQQGWGGLAAGAGGGLFALG